MILDQHRYFTHSLHAWRIFLLSLEPVHLSTLTTCLLQPTLPPLSKSRVLSPVLFVAVIVLISSPCPKRVAPHGRYVSSCFLPCRCVSEVEQQKYKGTPGLGQLSRLGYPPMKLYKFTRSDQRVRQIPIFLLTYCAHVSHRPPCMSTSVGRIVVPQT